MTDPFIFSWSEFPEGVLCEGCDRPFRDGDEIALYPHSMTASGIPVLTSLCPRCVLVRLCGDHPTDRPSA